jgi:multidrug resistance efflux pump
METIIGTVRGEEASVASRVAAKVLVIDASVGKHVNKGDVLIVLDDKDIRTQAQQARDQAAAATAALSKAETGRDLEAGDIQAKIAQAEQGRKSARIKLEQAEGGVTAATAQGTEEVATARAGVQAAQAQLDSALRGARPEERRKAEVQLEAAKKGLTQAQDSLDKITSLANNGALPKVRISQAQSQYDTALAQAQAAQATMDQIKAGATKEDLDAIRAQVAKAQAGLREATAGAKARDDNSKKEAQAARVGLENAEQSLRLAQGARAQLALNNADVKAAQAQVDNARTAARQAEEQVANTRIASALSGSVTAVNVNVGDYASPGRPLISIAATSGLYIEASVPTRLLNVFKPNATVGVAFDAYPGETFKGTVREVSAAANPDGRSYPAKIDMITRPAAGLRPGARARVSAPAR